MFRYLFLVIAISWIGISVKECSDERSSKIVNKKPTSSIAELALLADKNSELKVSQRLADSAIRTTTLTNNGAFSNAQICKATIAALMGRDPSVMHLVGRNEDGSAVAVRYARLSDGKVFDTECWIIGTRVVWRPYGGTWRNRQGDSEITYSINGKKITVMERFGSRDTIRKSFMRREIGTLGE